MVWIGSKWGAQRRSSQNPPRRPERWSGGSVSRQPRL